MTAMIQQLGLIASGGREGTIRAFKEQVTRFAACKYTIMGPGPRGEARHMHAEPSAIPAARIKVLCDPIISAVPQPIGPLFLAFETLF